MVYKGKPTFFFWNHKYYDNVCYITSINVNKSHIQKKFPFHSLQVRRKEDPKESEISKSYVTKSINRSVYEQPAFTSRSTFWIPDYTNIQGIKMAVSVAKQIRSKNAEPLYRTYTAFYTHVRHIFKDLSNIK